MLKLIADNIRNAQMSVALIAAAVDSLKSMPLPELKQAYTEAGIGVTAKSKAAVLAEIKHRLQERKYNLDRNNFHNPPGYYLTSALPAELETFAM